MIWHETSSTAGANLGYWKCECGVCKDGYQMWGEESKEFKDEIYNSAGFNDNEKVIKAAKESTIIQNIENILFDYADNKMHWRDGKSTLETAEEIFELVKNNLKI